MRFLSLFKELKRRDPSVIAVNPQRIRITGLSDDSRDVMPGNLFAAIAGAKFDGNKFIADALSKGAGALLTQTAWRESKLVPQIVSPHPRRTLGHLAAILHGDPSHDMKVVGVTGTNGKTTTAFALREIFEASGIRCGMLGTVNNIVGSEHREAKLTTPSVLKVHEMLAEMRAAGQQACVMEVSSHALHQERTSGVRFSGAVFTNLTQDHLDYHKDFESYFHAKSLLFRDLEPDHGCGLVNLDDEWGERMAEVTNAACFGFGQHQDADIRIKDLDVGLGGMSFSLDWIDRVQRFQSPMTGRYNAENLTAAAGMAFALDLPVEAIRKAIADFRGAPGRLQRVDFANPAPSVFVDYAHTPDALQNVLTTLRQIIGDRRLTVVVGCGGDRDAGKRPKMGAIAAQIADRPIITSDNPRTEDPVRIIEDILAGIPPQSRMVETVVDRREAIRKAIADAKSDEVIAIVGKGHEDYQIFSDMTVHFSDEEEARNALDWFWGHSGSGRRAMATI